MTCLAFGATTVTVTAVWVMVARNSSFQSLATAMYFPAVVSLFFTDDITQYLARVVGVGQVWSSLVYSIIAAAFVFAAVGACLLLDLAVGWATFDSRYQGSGIHAHNRLWWMGFIRAAGEEIGWRSFLLPCLMEQFTPPVALVISGIFWGLFHVPIMILLMYRFRPPRTLVTVFVQSLACALFAFPHGWVAVKSGYSLWASTVMHAVWNWINPWVLGSIYTQSPGLVTGQQWLINGEGLAGCLVMLPVAVLLALDLS